MAQVKIKRTTGDTKPTTVDAGELIYAYDTSGNGGTYARKLFIGDPTSNTNSPKIIGGEVFTEKLDHTAGTLTASSAVIVDASSKIDVLNVDNITLDGNSITSTDTNGNINITPDNTGKIVLDGQSWPGAVGNNGSYLKTDNSGVLEWAAVPSGSFTIEDNQSPANTDTFTTGETLTFSGSGATTTTISNNQVTISSTDTVYTLPEATSTVRGGIELFSDTDQTVAANSVSSTASRTYGIQLNSDGQAVVNVPWADTDTVYTLPEATSTVRGGIELFSNTEQTVAANTVSATASRTYGIQLNSDGQAVVNVPWVDTDTDTVYTLPEATSTVRGGIELFSDTDQTVAANSVSSTASRTYGIQLNSDGQAVVNVPWANTDENVDVDILTARLPQITESFSIGDASDVTITTSGNLSVTGDLIVNGTTTTVNSTTVTIDDPIFTLGGDTAPTSDDNKDRGIEFQWYDTAAKVGFFGFDDSTGKFTFIPDATNTSEVFSGTAGTIVADLEGNVTGNADGLTASNITEAAIDVTTDYLFFFDGGDSGTSAKESVADFVAAIAGTNISAANGVLSVATATDQTLGLARFGSTTEFTVTAGNVALNTVDGGSYP